MNEVLEAMKKDAISSRNVCLLIGVIFGCILPISYLFAIPSALLIIVGGIQMFEVTKSRKKAFETHVSFKLENFEKFLEEIKKENKILKVEVESLKTKLNISSFYNRTNA